MLDQEHLAAWSNDGRARTAFASGLSRFLESQLSSQVVPIFGEHATDLDGFCGQLERSLPGPGLERAIDGAGGLVSLLRSREFGVGLRPARTRYYIWHDCDAMIRENPGLFGRIAEAMLGVAAEDEYASDDLLLIHRVVFVGGSTLAVYHEDDSGRLQSWQPEPMGEPFWRAVSGVDAPMVLGTDLDDLSRRLGAFPATDDLIDDLLAESFEDSNDDGGW